MKPKLSIIMPMYNSRDITKNLEEASKMLEKVTKDYELILVDDGSTDDCRKEAEKFSNKKVRVVGYKQNQGKGAAIKYGFSFVKGEDVAFVDSGRDLNPRQITTFMKVMDEKKADIVIGSKRHKESRVHYPIMRRMMSRTYQIINKILFRLDIEDTQVGLKLFKKKVLDKVMPKIAIKRFAFDLELLVIANKYGFKIVEAPIIIRYKFGSTVNSGAVFWMLMDTAAIFYRDKILKYYD